VNPPYYVPLVEVVPAPWTEASVVTKTRDIMKEVGQVPVCFKREIEGFALNRIQWVFLDSSCKICATLLLFWYINLYCMDLTQHLQRQVSQYVASSLCLGSVLGAHGWPIQAVTNVW